MQFNIALTLKTVLYIHFAFSPRLNKTGKPKQATLLQTLHSKTVITK